MTHLWFHNNVSKCICFSMKTFFLTSFLFHGSLLIAQQPRTVASVEAGVKLEVFFTQTYQTTKDVHLEVGLQNSSARDIQLFLSTPSTYDTQIELTDPNGEMLTLNSELPGSLQHRVRKLNLVTLNTANNSVKEVINLSHDYAIKKAGTYCCRITKKFYFPDPSINRKSVTDAPGKSVSITSPQFSFEVKKIDMPYAAKLQTDADNRKRVLEGVNASSTSQQPKEFSGSSVNPVSTGAAKSPKSEFPTPPPSEEPALSPPWSIIAVLIVTATGLLWLLLKKHK
jgi:hypothetical protein